MPRRRIVDLAIVAAAIVLIVVLGSLRAAHTAGEYSEPSTRDTGANGYAALYDMLAKEDVRVERFELPVGELSGSSGTLVIAGDGAMRAAAPSQSALLFLNRWVKGGGRLVLLDGAISPAARRALNLPPARTFASRARAVTGCGFAPALRGAAVAGTFAPGYASACRADRATLLSFDSHAAGIVYRRGRGTIALFGTATVFDNLHLSQADNARVAYAVLSGGTVLFDERVHGYAAGRTFWEVLPQPMRIAIAIAVIAVLIAIAGANLPFAPPAQAEAPEERDSGAYITSIARMLERGGASQEAIARIAARCEIVLKPRAGGDERARMLLRELRTLEATPRPGPQEVLHAGRIFARVRKDYGC